MKRPRRQWTEADIKLLVFERVHGRTSYTKLAYMFGASVATIKKLCAEHGPPGQEYAAGSKYGSKGVRVGGQHFDSLGEANHYHSLRAREKAGEIHSLRRQPRYELLGFNGQPLNPRTFYVADFDYIEPGRGLVTEDWKGVRTPLYRLKAKLFRAQYGRDIVEIQATKRGRAAA